MDTPIPLTDLKREYQSIKPEIDRAIQYALDNANFILGKTVEDFENAFAGFCQTKYAVGVANGTDALRLALIACGIGKGDEVLIPCFTFIATAEAVILVGAIPRLIDVDSKTFNIDTRKAENAITNKTKAVIPVHLFGQPVDMNSLQKIARKNSLIIIEDVAQAHGAENFGKRVGSFGRAGCFSFYPSKNLAAYGDGGAVVSNDADLVAKIKLLRDHGRTEKYLHGIVGFNSRLDAIQAAVLSVKLKYLDKWNEKRRTIAEWYRTSLANVSEIVLPHSVPNTEPVYHLFVIRAKQRDELRTALQERGIQTGVHYYPPLHLQPSLSSLGYKKGDFPISEQLSNEVLSLPIFPAMEKEDVTRIAETIRKFYSSK
ncbi:MAG: hypothetical protein A2W23_07850 [Planctomycetes bacterium RBG_16_43_13]|nr:MAG: hypothetical protein A2W23_07850 [Planctomycetes bacterium RBG_16_43_13]